MKEEYQQTCLPVLSHFGALIEIQCQSDGKCIADEQSKGDY